MFNKYQTQPTEEFLNKLPKEIQEQYYDCITNIPYIRKLIAADRPYAKDLPRDEEGKIIVDITNPHILEDTDYFRPSAIHFKKYGCYTKLKPNANPNSEYGKWIREEIRRCWEGYVRESDGEWITGDMYFFLNYCPIQLIKKDAKGNTIRTLDFPRFWDGHYYKAHYLNQCRLNGHHAMELASRGKGKSLYAAAMLAKRFILGESKEVNKKVQSVATASERKYIQGAYQLLDMFQYYIDFCANNTEFPRQRLTSSLQNMQWTMGYLDAETMTRRGTENSVIGITSKDDESKLRGSRGVLYLLEESGCHLKGTECFKFDKTTEKVENIKVGDLLLGPDMQSREVKKVFTGTTDMYKITLSNGDTQIVTNNHPVYVKVRTWGKKAKEEFKTFTCEELLQDDYKQKYYIIKLLDLYEPSIDNTNTYNYLEYSFNIEYYGKGEYYGFLLDKDHLFLLKDKTIVHNTFPRLLKLYQVLRPSVEDGNSVWGLLFGYGCCCAGTKVIKENGEVINIEDVNINDKLIGYNGLTSSVENISWKQPIGYKECVRITTEKGNSLECSIDHPILALNKDKFGHSLGSCSFYRASELKIGDTLLMPRKIGSFGHIHEKHAFLLGALFGDGNYSNNSCVSLSICTEEEYEFYNNHYNIGISKLSKGKNTYAQIYFRKLHPLLKKYDMDKQSFEGKKLPNNIFDWDKESVCAFLSGYFNADGNIQIVKEKHRSIKLTCKYKNSLLQVKQLLSKLGISSHIYRENKPSRILHSNVNNKIYNMPPCYCYVLYISNSEDIIIFRNNLKFLIKEKQDRLDSYNVSCKKRIAYNLKFKLRDNGKGKLLENNTFDNLQCVTIKNIEELDIQRIYNMTADTTHTYISNGFISSNTAGDSDSDFSSMQELMYNPKGYNIQEVDNIYDKEGQGRKYFTYFFPGYMNRSECYDEDGNSDVIKALLEILQDRYTVKYNSTDINAITKRIAEIPITPQEAILKSRGNIFPITEITARLNEIDNNPNFYDDTYIGTFVLNSNGEVEFNSTTNLTPIREFPTKDNKLEGAVEIYEMPQKINDKIPNDRYIMSLDNYENDEAQSMSLGSMFVLDLWTDRIVAEYTGRPLFADDLNELARKMALYYNARILYENNKKSTFAYFSKMNSLHLLADTPEYLRNKQLIKSTSWGNSSKGVTATVPIKNFGFTLIRDWLLKPVKIIKEEGEETVEYTVPNLHFIKNRALLKELMLFNPDINVDRIMSLVQLMLYREEKMILYKGNPETNYNKNSMEDTLANDAFFTRNYKGSKFSDFS